MNERQEYIINKLNDIADIAQELMKEAVTGEDGNLNEMSYHIKCYSKKIVAHLLHEWKNNAKFAQRKEERKEKQKELKKKEDEEVQQLIEKIFRNGDQNVKRNKN